MTRNAFGRHVDVHPATIVDIELERTNTKFETILKILHGLDLELQDFVNYINEQKAN